MIGVKVKGHYGPFTRGGTMNLINSFPFPGANDAESQSPINIVAGHEAAGLGGVKVIRVKIE